MSLRVLCIDDDTRLFELLASFLEPNGVALFHAADGRQGLAALEGGVFDAVLLDVMMPGIDGLEVCKRIRQKSQVPVIMLTAKGDETDRVVGLELGADDYITKPFGVKELLARVAAALRRAHAGGEGAPEPLPEEFKFGRATIHTKKFEALRNGETFTLTPRELKLIELFLGKPNEALSRQYLLDQAWGIDYLGTTRTLDQHIAQLRKKIEPDDEKEPAIATVHGVGYMYKKG